MMSPDRRERPGLLGEPEPLGSDVEQEVADVAADNRLFRRLVQLVLNVGDEPTQVVGHYFFTQITPTI